MTQLQPYQVFFPIGLLYALWGALIWLFHLAGWMDYPGPAHAHLMIGGFLFSFSLGFLMTAVPKFTGSPPTQPWELIAGAVLSLILFFAPILGTYQAAVALAVLLFLSFFFISRIRRREYSPPPHFVFVPIGLAFGIAGSILMLAGEGPGRVFLFQATMLSFVLGVGGKLVSALLGWGEPPLVQLSRVGQLKPGPKLPLRIVVPVVLLLAGFLVEIAGWSMFGRVLRALSATYVAADAWKLYRLPKNKGRLVIWLWHSAIGLVLGLWLYALAPSLGVHALHLMFVSGFGLMTLMIASRVTLAHGGYDLEIEIKSPALRWTGVLIMLAAVVRVIAPLTSSYMSFLGFAAFLWVASVLIWSAAFISRILKSAA